MKLYIRLTLSLLLFFSFKICNATDFITCNLQNSGIPQQSILGNAYYDTYQCNNSYPRSFPAIQLTGNVKNNSNGVNLSGSCVTQQLSPGQSCQFLLSFNASSLGLHEFYLEVSVGSLYYINLPDIRTTVINQPVKPSITWPGRNSGSAHVDADGNGDGVFTADATDSSGHAVFYSFKLNGPGTVKQGVNSNIFDLEGANGTNETITVTANADDANSVSGNPIPIVKSNILIKKIAIYNNSDKPIYPIIEAPKLEPRDAWLQAEFKETNINQNTYQQTNVYRIYVNPTTGGIPAHGSAIVNVPFYSQLAQNPNPALPNQYIDWWNSMRVYIYDDLTYITSAYNLDKQNPISSLTPGLTCNNVGTGCHEALTILKGTTNLPLFDPSQLTEYTFANVVTSTTIPFPIDTHFVDYDISYVDHVYLPIAMEPYNNNQVGYTGSTMILNHFREILDSFVTDSAWPIYDPLPAYPNKKIPGTYNAIIGGQPLTSNTIFDNLKNYWNQCTTDINNPQHANCLAVKDLFDKNASNYQAVCSAPAPTFNEYIQHIYGWVAFNCDQHTNDLAYTPDANYHAAENAYQALEYSTNIIGQTTFNPYVNFIHGANYLNMNAYAFSIDDAVGNMNEEGDGIVITVAGPTGLPNPNPFDKNKVANINLGAPTGTDPKWAAYGICSATPNHTLPTGSLNFKIQTITMPCEITVQDDNNRLYHFTLIKVPPFEGPNKSDYIQCAANDTWCNAINIDFTTKHDIDTQAPVALALKKVN